MTGRDSGFPSSGQRRRARRLLAYCLKHHIELARRPSDFLPWALRDVVGLRAPSTPAPSLAISAAGPAS